MNGILGMSYAKGRANKRALRYRLWRRTNEVLSALTQFGSPSIGRILDLGTADGRMPHSIQNRFPATQCVGIEYSRCLAEFGKRHFAGIQLVQGDIHHLMFRDQVFDAVVLSAVIEHAGEPEMVVGEAWRVLKKDGVIVLTSPDPFWEKVATRMGHLQEDQHHHVWDLIRLGRLLTRHGFKVIQSGKFMISPIGMPFERGIEGGLKRIGASFLLANQLLVGRR